MKTLWLRDLPTLTELVNKHWDSADESRTLWPPSAPRGQFSSDTSVEGEDSFCWAALPSVSQMCSPFWGFHALHFWVCAVPFVWNIPSLTNKLNVTPIHSSSLNHEVIFPRKSWCCPDLMCLLSSYTDSFTVTMALHVCANTGSSLTVPHL